MKIYNVQGITQALENAREPGCVWHRKPKASGFNQQQARYSWSPFWHVLLLLYIVCLNFMVDLHSWKTPASSSKALLGELAVQSAKPVPKIHQRDDLQNLLL